MLNYVTLEIMHQLSHLQLDDFIVKMIQVLRKNTRGSEACVRSLGTVIGGGGTNDYKEETWTLAGSSLLVCGVFVVGTVFPTQCVPLPPPRTFSVLPPPLPPTHI